MRVNLLGLLGLGLQIEQSPTTSLRDHQTYDFPSSRLSAVFISSMKFAWVSMGRLCNNINKYFKYINKQGRCNEISKK